MAGRIPQQFIDELISRVDIVDVIDARVPLRKAGREYTACCPFHQEKTPSFTVSPTKQFYHCFGCGAHGTALGFLMEYEHMEFVEAVEELAASVNLEVPREQGDAPRGPGNGDLYTLLGEAAAFYGQQLKTHPAAAQAVDYLKRRGLSGEIARDFGIGYAPPGWDALLRALGRDTKRQKRMVDAGLLIEKDDGGRYDRFRERIMFPIRDTRGRVIAFGGRILDSATTDDNAKAGGPKYLNSPETAVFHKGRELYGLYEARQALRQLPRLLVVEGYMDVVSLAQFGVRYGVATLGTAVTGEHVERLFRTSGEVVFCFDGDRAGRDAAWRGLQNALPYMRDGRQLRFMFLPEGEDPDTLIRRIGRDAFEELLAGAMPLSSFFFQQLRAKVDMNSLDGRAQLMELARPYLSKLPEGAFRQLMTEELAKTAGTRTGSVGQLLEPAPQPVQPKRRPPRPNTGRSAPTPVRHAIALLLHHPELAAQGGEPSRFAGIALPGLPLLMELLELLQEQPHLSTGAIVEHWRNSDAGRHLANLAATAPLLEEAENLVDEFKDTMRHIEQQRDKQRRAELTAKPFAELSPAERLELQQLMRTPSPARGPDI